MQKRGIRRSKMDTTTLAIMNVSLGFILGFYLGVLSAIYFSKNKTSHKDDKTNQKEVLK